MIRPTSFVMMRGDDSPKAERQPAVHRWKILSLVNPPMKKTFRQLALRLLPLAAPLGSSQLTAQDFALERYSITGGVGVSQGGGFSLSGTAGALAVPVLSGGGFSVAPGFWSVVTVIATPEAPALQVQLNPDGTVTISWPAFATGFVLQQTTALGSGVWLPALFSVGDDGTWKSVRLVPPPGQLFFRLAR